MNVLELPHGRIGGVYCIIITPRMGQRVGQCKVMSQRKDDGKTKHRLPFFFSYLFTFNFVWIKIKKYGGKRYWVVKSTYFFAIFKKLSRSKP